MLNQLDKLCRLGMAFCDAKLLSVVRRQLEWLGWRCFLDKRLCSWASLFDKDVTVYPDVSCRIGSLHSTCVLGVARSVCSQDFLVACVGCGVCCHEISLIVRCVLQVHVRTANHHQQRVQRTDKLPEIWVDLCWCGVWWQCLVCPSCALPLQMVAQIWSNVG